MVKIEYILKTYDLEQLDKFMDSLRLSKYELVIKTSIMSIVKSCRDKLNKGGSPLKVEVLEKTDWVAKISITKAVDESDEWIKDIHGPVYLKQGKAEFVEDNYFEFCLSDYVKALTTMEESPCLK